MLSHLALLPLQEHLQLKLGILGIDTQESVLFARHHSLGIDIEHRTLLVFLAALGPYKGVNFGRVLVSLI